MKCQDFEGICLTSLSSLPPAAQEHLSQCAECRKLYKLLLLLETAQLSPSHELDKKTLQATLPLIRMKKAKIFFSFQRLLAFAACLLVLFSLTFLASRNSSKAEGKLTLSQQPSGKAENSEGLAESHSCELWYLAGEEARDELDDLELQLYLYANLP